MTVLGFHGILHAVGLRPPALRRGRANYFATRGAVALAIAQFAMLSGYGFSGVGSAPLDQVTRAGIALAVASTYAVSIRCLVGFWSVPTAERTAEGLLVSARRDRWIVEAGLAASIAGSVWLVSLVLLVHR